MASTGSRGGKYPALGYYGNNTAGVPHEFEGKDVGTRREFIGSGENEYVFEGEHGTLTIRADSWQEAWRIAKARGYKRKYKRKN